MLPKRKQHRLPGYDYAQNGCYFVTVCTKDRRPILGEIAEWGYAEKSATFSRPCIVDENGLFLPLDANGDTAPVGFDAHIEPSVGLDAHIEPQIKLSYYGQIVERYLRSIPGIYAYAIMPNHVHLMINITDNQTGNRSMRASTPTDGESKPMWASAPTDGGSGPMWASIPTYGGSGPMWASIPTSPVQSISTRIRSFKVLTSKAVGFSLWQSSFYDHVIRSEAESLRILQYILTNPARWAEDEYYQT